MCPQMLLWVLLHGEMEQSHFFLAGKSQTSIFTSAGFVMPGAAAISGCRGKGHQQEWLQEGLLDPCLEPQPDISCFSLPPFQRDFREGKIPSLILNCCIAKAALEEQQVPAAKGGSCSHLPEINKCEVFLNPGNPGLCRLLFY